MPRRTDEGLRRSGRDERDESDSEDSNYSTDTDCEYQLSPEETQRIAGQASVSEKAVNEAYIKQRGICRISGLPFDSGMYTPVLVPRKASQPLADDNCMIVLDVIDRMRAASGMNWRTFVRFMQVAGKEAEL